MQSESKNLNTLLWLLTLPSQTGQSTNLTSQETYSFRGKHLHKIWCRYTLVFFSAFWWMKIKTETERDSYFLSYQLWTDRLLFKVTAIIFQQSGNRLLIKTKTDVYSLRSLHYQTYDHYLHKNESSVCYLPRLKL